MSNNHTIPDNFQDSFHYGEDVSDHIRATKTSQPKPAAVAPPEPPFPSVTDGDKATLGEQVTQIWNGLFKKDNEVSTPPIVVETPPLADNNVGWRLATKHIEWVVPADSKGIQVDIIDATGQSIGSYTITDYLNIPPLSTLKVRSF